MLRRVRLRLTTAPDRFLRDVSGVIHVGANIGQERELYAEHGLRVVWIEPIPEVFEELQANIADLPQQRALQCLVAEQDNVEYEFHIANNHGASSSVYELNLHKDIWPEIAYKRTIMLRSKTLPSLLVGERIDCSQYDCLVIDTQGSELLILKGAVSLLKHFTYIKTEVPDFDSYTGCCKLADIASFLTNHAYREFSRNKFAERRNGGSYYDIVYKRLT